MRAHKSQTTGSERGSIGDEERRSPSGGGARRGERVEERGAGEAAQDGEPLAGVATGARAGAASAHVHTMSNFNELHIGSELYNVEKGLPPSEGVEENKEMEVSEGRGRSKCDDDAPEPEGSKRLCGGCNSFKHRDAFEAEQWMKEEAWSRATARRCTQCSRPPDDKMQSPGGKSTLAGRRTGRRRRATDQGQTNTDECLMRSLEQILCPSSCQCANSVPLEPRQNTHGCQSGIATKVRAIRGEGLHETAAGVFAMRHIAQGEIITCFGNSATVVEGSEGQELVRTMSNLAERGKDLCQYTFTGTLGGEGVSPLRVWVVPPPDIRLLSLEPISRRLTQALAQRGPDGVGHLINHSCCRTHRNAELAVRWMTEDRGVAVVVAIATRAISPGERVLVHYSPEGSDFRKWSRNFRCKCCKCRGACDRSTSPGPEKLMQAMRGGLPKELGAELIWQRDLSLTVGVRVQVDTLQGTFDGTVTRCDGSSVQVCGQRGSDTSEGMVTVTVDRSECVVLRDHLKWEDLEFEANSLQRVVYQEHANNQSDFLDDKVLTAMLRWGLYGDSEEEGIPACTHRDWVMNTYAFGKVLLAWEDQQSLADPLASLLQVLSQPSQRRQTTSGGAVGVSPLQLQMDPDFLDNIYLPVNLSEQHWLLAWIDTHNREMHLLDCSKAFGDRHSSTIHGLMWVWFLASVRKLNATLGEEIAEPVWSIDALTVDLNTLKLLPGFTRRNCTLIQQHRAAGTGSLTEVETILGSCSIGKLTNLNIVVRWGGQCEARHWQWSSTTQNVPQQTRYSDCAIFTFLFAIFKARRWDLKPLTSIDPKQVREWVLRVLLREGTWTRKVTCRMCGVLTTRPSAQQDTPPLQCQGAELAACQKRRRQKRTHGQTSAGGLRPPSAQGQSNNEGSAEGSREENETTCKEPQAKRTGKKDAETVLGEGVARNSSKQGSGKTDQPAFKEPSSGPMSSQKKQRTSDTEPEQTVGKPCHSTCPATSPRQPRTAEDRQPRSQFHKAVFQVRGRAQGTCEASTKCVGCGRWGAPIQADAGSNSYVCNKRCWEKWWMTLVRRKRDDKLRKSDHDSNLGIPDGAPPGPPDTSCAGCGEKQARHPCGRCWGPWYCTEACRSTHWDTHQHLCQGGSWCAQCGSQEQRSWCPDCNRVAYCSSTCREKDWHIHRQQCDGRWRETCKEGQGAEGTPGLARSMGYEAILEGDGHEAQIMQFRNQCPSKQALDDPGTEDQTVTDDKQGVHTDALIRLITETQQSDEARSGSCQEAADRARDRREGDEKELRATLASLAGPIAAEAATIEILKDRRWARMWLRPFLHATRATRTNRLFSRWEHQTEVHIRMYNVPAESEEQALRLLADAGIAVIPNRGNSCSFSRYTNRSTARHTTLVEACVTVNGALQKVWCGQRTIGGAEVVCESVDEDPETDDEGACMATLLPTHSYCRELLPQWNRMWKLLGLTDLEVRDMVIWSVERALPTWKIDELQVWSPGPPRSFRAAWEGRGASQGQVRLKGERIATEHRNTLHLGNAHAIGGRNSFETRDKTGDQHLPRGATRCPQRVELQLGLPLEGSPALPDPGPSRDGEAVMRTAPDWVRLGQIGATWEPTVPGSEWEATSAVCIRFLQIRQCRTEGQEQPDRTQIRNSLLELVNNIQEVSGLSDRKFEAPEVCYAAFTNGQGHREGLITIQKRDADLLDNDILVGTILGFYVGNDVQNLTTRKFKWCPISGRLGNTACGVVSMTAAHSWGGQTRRQLRMGTQKAGERTWRIRDPKEGTVRRILALARGRKDAKDALLARLRTTPWSRRKIALAKGAPERQMGTDTVQAGEPIQLPVPPTGTIGDMRQGVTREQTWTRALQGWDRDWGRSLAWGTNDLEHMPSIAPREMLGKWHCIQGDSAAARAVTGDWVLLHAALRERARIMAKVQLEKALREDTFEQYMQELREKGHVGLANEGLRVWSETTHSGATGSRPGIRDRIWAWRGWLDWEVQMTRPQMQSNVSTWNLGPLGYEASKEQLRAVLKGGQAVVMVQELSFPAGAQRRVKRELNDLHPDYHCIMEVGRQAVTNDCEDAASGKWTSPWHSGKRLAVASFFHASVFKTVQRLEWDTEGKTRGLRHMTRGRVLWVDAVTHGGKKLRTINVHQATSGDLDLQERVLGILRKAIEGSRNQMILLGGDINANAGGDRVGYARSNEHHMSRVDGLFADFVRETGGRRVSPDTLSWKGGDTTKGARLDHFVCWNMTMDDSARTIGLEWQAVGKKAPEGSKRLEHEQLQRLLAQSTVVSVEDWARLDLRHISAQCVVQVGEEFFRPVVYGRADWLGDQKHDHARVCALFAADVLIFERGKQKGPKARSRRIDLDDWKRITPTLGKALQEKVQARRVAVQEGSIDAGTAVAQTLRERNQLAGSLHAPTVKARKHQQRRGEHRNRKQIHLLRDIARAEAALKDGPQAERVTWAQELCLRDTELSTDRPLGLQEKLAVTQSEHWTCLLEERIRVNKVALQALTQAQVQESRRDMDFRARRAFEQEHKGPSKFAGKRLNSRQPELLRWAVPVGFQWIAHCGPEELGLWQRRAKEIRRACPSAKVLTEMGDVCVAVVPVRGARMDQAEMRIADACKSWSKCVAGHDREAFAEELCKLVRQRRIRATTGANLKNLTAEAIEAVAARISQDGGAMAIGRGGLRGKDEVRWCSKGPRARELMNVWLHHLGAATQEVSPFSLKWEQDELVITHEESGDTALVDEVSIWQKACHKGTLRDHEKEASGGWRTQDPAQSTEFGPASFPIGGSQDPEMQAGTKSVMLTVTVGELTDVSNALRTSQGWDTVKLINRQILFEQGPWKETNMTIAWELYFQTQGLAPHAWCGTTGCERRQPHVVMDGFEEPRSPCTNSCRQDQAGEERATSGRRILGGFCSGCWKHVGLREGREEVSSIEFMRAKGIFKRASKVDPGARLRGRISEDEFQKFVDNYLKNNKSPGPDGIPNECLKTMSREELDILRMWANEILAYDRARLMTIEEMNGTISLLHKGGDTDDSPRDWRPVVLLNCTNQLIMHVLNSRLREIVERAGILEPGQAGGRHGRSTDINLAKLEWVTREALTQGRKVYRVDVDFTNAFNAMSQAALWEVMRAYGIPDVDLLVGLYANSTVRIAPNDDKGATITFDTGVAQGSALSPLLFLIFMNALLGLLTATGQELHISHGLVGRGKKVGRHSPVGRNDNEVVGQFNSIGFVDDLSLFAQSRGGAQALLNKIQEFEEWSGLKVNHKKTCVMIVGRDRKQSQGDLGLTYHGREIKTLSPSTACRYLGLWGTADGDMTETKRRIFQKTKEARDMLEHHPLTPEQAVELFGSVGVGAFRYTAALVPWTEGELRRLESIWVQAYKRAWLLPLSTASDIFTLPEGLEYPRPLGIMAQELCRHLQRCIKHDDVAKQIAQHDLDQALDQWACSSLDDLQQEMGLWEWNQTLQTKWTRAAKCMQLLKMPFAWEPARLDEETSMGTSWAKATRELRKLRQRVEAMGGNQLSWEAGVWHMDKEQWKLVWEGEAAFWRIVPKLMAAGCTTVETMAQSACSGDGKVRKIPLLTRVNKEEGTQTVRILLTRDVTGVNEKTRGTVQRWLDMVDWRAAQIGSASENRKRSVAWFLTATGNRVRKDHPARKWAEGQEARPPGRATTSRVIETRQGAEILWRAISHQQGQELDGPGHQPSIAEAADAINPGLHPEMTIRCLLRLIKGKEIEAEVAHRLMEAIGAMLPPGWGAQWQDLVSQVKGGSMLATTAEIVKFIRARESACSKCQTRLTAECRECEVQWCKRCAAQRRTCEICEAPVASGDSLEEAEQQVEDTKSQGGRKLRKMMKGTGTVNMHVLGERFVESVSDVRATPADQQSTEDPGAGLQFLAQIRGWQSGLALARKKQLLERNDIGLAAALEWAAGTDIFFIPKGHFPGYTPDDDAEGWWYSVKGKERCRKCFQCHRRAAHHDFSRREWVKKSPATCVLCTSGRGEKRAREGGLKRAPTENKISRNRVAVGRQGGRGNATGTREVSSTRPKRPRRAATSTRVSLADRSESESETEIQEDEWPDHEAQVCIILVPANPQYVGRGNDSNGGEIAYTVPEIRGLLRDQPGYGQMWLTTGQMGWSLVQERNEIVNAQDNMEGKPTARKLAPAISSYIRGLSDEVFHTTDRERKETLAAAWELDQIWGAWNDERTTEGRGAQWMESMPEDSHDIRNQITASIIRHQRCWEPPFRSQLADDPQVLPDAGLKAQVGRDLFLDEKLPRGAGGQGYVAVTETSIVWKESRAAEVFTYQGLTSCMEPGEIWTIAGSIWHHLSKCTLRREKELRALIYQEVNYQNQVEAEGYRSPTWRMLRALQEVHGATRLQGESAVTAPPFFANAGRGKEVFWGSSDGPTVFLWESLDEDGRKECERVMSERRDWIVWSRTRPGRKKDEVRGFKTKGKALFEGRAQKRDENRQSPCEDNMSEDEMEEEHQDQEKTRGRACRQRGWWKRGAIETSVNSAGMTAWVHTEHAEAKQEVLQKLQLAWECGEEKDECEVRLSGLERAYWIGSEVGRIGGYEFQGAVFGIDGSNHKGHMGAGCCRLGTPDAEKMARVGREEEGSSSNRPELGGVVLALRQAELHEDVLILCDNESVLKVIRKWVGQGGRATMAVAPDADILKEILELLRARINAGRATFFFKVKSHRGEALNERADTLAERGREKPDEEKEWNQRTDRMTFAIERDNVQQWSVWTNSVRNAFRKQAGKAKLQQVYGTAEKNWAARVWFHQNQRWLQATHAGRTAARAGKFKDEQEWGKECFEDLEARNMGKSATNTWCTDFLVRDRVGREEMGRWLRNKAVPWKRRRRLIQVVTGTFPCGNWLHKIGRRESAGCALCKTALERRGMSTQALPPESIGHIQSAGCLGQSEVVTAAHNRCIKDLLRDIQTHKGKKSKLVMISIEAEQTIDKMWDQDECSFFCTKEELWEESKLAEMAIPFKDRNESSPVSEQDFKERFWRRRLDGIAMDKSGKKCFPIEFKRTQDCRHTYQERATDRAEEQYRSLLVGLQAIGERKGWQVQQLVFVGGTCGSVEESTYNDNMKLLEVPEGKWGAIRKKMTRRLLEEQDKVLRSYFAQKYGQGTGREGDKGRTMKPREQEHLGHDVYA